jgi:UTP-glucose-1-phosphate uridylyltransferase
VFPIIGSGTRFLQPTKTAHKEMLPTVVTAQSLRDYARIALVEKPEPAQAPLAVAAAGLYVRGVIYAHWFVGKRYGCGSKLDFAQATVDLASRHSKIGAEFAPLFGQRGGPS